MNDNIIKVSVFFIFVVILLIISRLFRCYKQRGVNPRYIDSMEDALSLMSKLKDRRRGIARDYLALEKEIINVAFSGYVKSIPDVISLMARAFSYNGICLVVRNVFKKKIFQNSREACKFLAEIDGVEKVDNCLRLYVVMQIKNDNNINNEVDDTDSLLLKERTMLLRKITPIYVSPRDLAEVDTTIECSEEGISEAEKFALQFIETTKREKIKNITKERTGAEEDFPTEEFIILVEKIIISDILEEALLSMRKNRLLVKGEI